MQGIPIDSTKCRVIRCNKDTIEALHLYIRRANALLEMYKWVADAYVSDFFVKDHWDKLPYTWQNVLVDMTPAELSYLLDNSKTPTLLRVLPLSLMAYRASIRTYSAPRTPVSLDDPVDWRDIFTAPAQHTSTAAACSTNIHPPTSQVNGAELNVQVKDGQCLKLSHPFRRHVKPKKQHEILRLGQVVNHLCRSCGIQRVVDVGAGLGHLSRLLTFGYGLTVTTVEASGCHAPKADKYDRQIEKEIQRAKEKQGQATENILETHTQDFPSHVTHMIHQNMSSDDFLKVLRQACSQENAVQIKSDSGELDTVSAHQEDASFKGMGIYSQGCSTDQKSSMCMPTDILEYNLKPVSNELHNLSSDSEGFDCKTSLKSTVHSSEPTHILGGLHACGDLTPTTLRVFVNCSETIGLASVSCCYMKLTCKNESNEKSGPVPDLGRDCGYPMSDFVSQLPANQLTYEAREMACHFIEAYIQRLKENRPNLILHCYRAVLEVIVNKKDPEYQHGCIKLTFKFAEKMPFKEYAVMGLKRLGIDAAIADELLQEAESYLPFWKNVVSFYTVRLCLAPVIETLILLDRMVYLFEQGIPSVLVPIFDPSLSPRNFVLLAAKR